MGEPREQALLRVAEAITDGVPVPWESVVRVDEQPDERLDRLKSLEAIAAAHRALSAGNTTVQSATAASVIPAAASQPMGVWGHLRLLARIGKGGFGEVFRAYDPALQCEVALKLARPGALEPTADEERVMREARRLAQVRHPNVLIVHGADRHDGRIGLWTELVDGKTLEERLDEEGALGAHEAALIGIDLCAALAAVHGAGLVHGDVKTGNVMRARGGRTVLMDFGSSSRASGHPEARAISGTPTTMPPEVILEGEAPRAAADIYGLGVLLFRLVTGRFPIEAGSLAELREKHRRCQRLRLRDLRPELPGGYVNVVERAIDPDPSARFSTPAALEEALREAIGAPFPPDSRKIRTWSLSRNGVWFATTGALSAVLALLVALYLPGRSASPLSVEASLFRGGGGAEAPLLDGDRVQSGDALFLELRAEDPVHVYVINEDERGEMVVLFPLGLDLANPLPGGILHRLPGRRGGVQQNWAVTAGDRSETILVIASRNPLADLEREILPLPHAASDPKGGARSIDSRVVERIVRGIGGLTGERKPPGQGSGRLKEIATMLAGSRTSDAPWLRFFELSRDGGQETSP